MANHKIVEQRQLRIQKIEEEFGESMVDIVAGFRDMGYSYKDIAGSLEIPYGTFLKWQRRIPQLASDGERKWQRGILHNSIDKKAQQLGYQNARHAVRVLRHTMTRKDIGKLLNCHPASLYRHTPDEVKYIQVRTEKQIEARRKSAMALNEKRRKTTAERNRRK